MIQRKLFHLLILFIFIPGLKSPIFLSAAFLSIFDILLLLELIRHISDKINSFFLRFIDERDSKDIIVTHIYLLLGVGLPVFGSVMGFQECLYISGILSLGVGDSFASIIGYYFGRIKIPYRKKTVEGFLACWISMIIGIIALEFEVSYLIIIKLGFIAIYEAYTLYIDNLVLPVFAMGILSL